MGLINCHFYLYLFFIFLINTTTAMYSMQCCTSNDNSCSSAPVDCPSNVCFKLVIYTAEERGCLDDLIKLVNLANKGSRTLNDNNNNGLRSDSTNDHCQKIGTYGSGMSLCKCTSHLCNSSSKQIHLTKYFFFILHYILFVGI